MPTLTESLTRLADRGPHAAPDAVIATARAASVADPTRNLPRSWDDVELDLESSGAVSAPRPSRRVPVIAAMMLCVAAIGGGVVIARQRPSAPAAAQATDVSSQPITPLSLTEPQRKTAIERCAEEFSNDKLALYQLIGVVDGRPGGLFVGITTPTTFRTCELTFPGGPSGILQSGFPISLAPVPTPEQPVSVIGSKAPEGNQINGDEVVWVWGRVDPSVTYIEISSSTARYVPTIENGLYAAWWPGNDGDQTVVRWFDATGNELGFIDQLNCSTAGPTVAGGGLVTPMTPRLVVGGTYVRGGCIGGENVPAGTTADDIGD